MSDLAHSLSSNTLKADSGLASSFKSLHHRSTAGSDASDPLAPIVVTFMPPESSPSTRREQGKSAGSVSASGLIVGSAREGVLHELSQLQNSLKRQMAAQQAGKDQIARAPSTAADSPWPYVVVLPSPAAKVPDQTQLRKQRSMLDSDELSETLSAAARTVAASKTSAMGADLLATPRSAPQARTLLSDAGWVLFVGNIMGNLLKKGTIF